MCQYANGRNVNLSNDDLPAYAVTGIIFLLADDADDADALRAGILSGYYAPAARSVSSASSASSAGINLFRLRLHIGKSSFNRFTSSSKRNLVSSLAYCTVFLNTC